MIWHGLVGLKVTGPSYFSLCLGGLRSKVWGCMGFRIPCST